jgi:hypothetical protein
MNYGRGAATPAYRFGFAAYSEYVDPQYESTYRRPAQTRVMWRGVAQAHSMPHGRGMSTARDGHATTTAPHDASIDVQGRPEYHRPMWRGVARGNASYRGRGTGRGVGRIADTSPAEHRWRHNPYQAVPIQPPPAPAPPAQAPNPPPAFVPRTAAARRRHDPYQLAPEGMAVTATNNSLLGPPAITVVVDSARTWSAEMEWAAPPDWRRDDWHWPAPAGRVAGMSDWGPHGLATAAYSNQYVRPAWFTAANAWRWSSFDEFNYVFPPNPHGHQAFDVWAPPSGEAEDDSSSLSSGDEEDAFVQYLLDLQHREHARRMTPNTVERLRVPDDSSCSICLCDFDESDSGASTPDHLITRSTLTEVVSCHHVFHTACLAQWCARDPRCPLCRVYVKLASEPLPLPTNRNSSTIDADDYYSDQIDGDDYESGENWGSDSMAMDGDDWETLRRLIAFR